MWSILVFPALFAAGMSLVDTTDNILMLGAYGWAFVKPIRKIYYNMTITSVSVDRCLCGGWHRSAGIVGRAFPSERNILECVIKLNENFGTLGYFIIGLFVLSWIASIVILQMAAL